jgi:hypothetical protein
LSSPTRQPSVSLSSPTRQPSVVTARRCAKPMDWPFFSISDTICNTESLLLHHTRRWSSCCNLGFDPIAEEHRWVEFQVCQQGIPPRYTSLIFASRKIINPLTSNFICCVQIADSMGIARTTTLKFRFCKSLPRCLPQIPI